VASCAHGRQALADVAAAGRGPRVYEKHDPFAQPLHQVVRENLATFYAAIEEGWDSRLPAFVRAEFAGYLDCSVLQRGFAHLAYNLLAHVVPAQPLRQGMWSPPEESSAGRAPAEPARMSPKAVWLTPASLQFRNAAGPVAQGTAHSRPQKTSPATPW